MTKNRVPLRRRTPTLERALCATRSAGPALRIVHLCAAALVLSGCSFTRPAHRSPAVKVQAATADKPKKQSDKLSPGAASAIKRSKNEPKPSQTKALPPVKPLPLPDARTRAQARKLVQKGARFYSRGDYENSEQSLKEAITLYPFLAEANLALGKVFLIRGSATRDMALVNSARLMFEMALAIDPKMREAAVLLELFKPEPLE